MNNLNDFNKLIKRYVVQVTVNHFTKYRSHVECLNISQKSIAEGNGKLSFVYSRCARNLVKKIRDFMAQNQRADIAR